MARKPDVDPRRLQGIPRVKIASPEAGDVWDADDAAMLSKGYGLTQDPWQLEILKWWMCRREDGRWTHSRCGLAVPRQNGKNGALEARELFGLIELHEAILHTAHEMKTARKAWKRLKEFFGEKRDDPTAKYPELNALVADIRKTNGQEAIVLKDVWLVDGVRVRSVGRPTDGVVVEFVARGGFIEFGTRTGAAGRGTTFDLLIIDEAQHLTGADLAAVRPTISSGQLGNSQVIYLGTPPDPKKIRESGLGEAWLRFRKKADLKKPGVCWVEYGVADGPLPDLDDIELLYQANPSLDVVHGNGSHGLDLETVLGERDELDDEDYARERLGWWGDPESRTHRGVIDMTEWAELKVAGDTLPARGLIVVDVHPDLTWSTVALATDGPDDRPLGLIDHHEGTRRVVARIKQLTTDLTKVLEVCLTPAAAIFSADLTKADIEHRTLAASEVGDACMALQKMIPAKQTAHVAQPELDQNARAAVTRYISDRQQWDRRDRDRDSTPIVAYSCAVHLWAKATAKPDKPAGKPRRHTAGQPIPAGPPAAQSRRRGAAGGFDPRTSGF